MQVKMRTHMRWWIIVVVTSLASALLAGDRGVAAPAYKPEGEMRYAVYVTISPAWFDPAEVATAGITPFWFCYALHDAMLKPMPDNPMAPGLAESWTVSPDQRVYEFKLREGLKFHNGDPFTSPFALSILHILNFKLPVKISSQPQPLDDGFLHR